MDQDFYFQWGKKMHECQTGFDKNTSLLISFFPYLKEMLVYYGDRNIINVMREREQSYEMDEKLMKELAAFIDLADGNESEEKIRTVFGVQTPG